MASDKGKKSSKTVTTIPANDDGTEKKRALDIALAVLCAIVVFCFIYGAKH